MQDAAQGGAALWDLRGSADAGDLFLCAENAVLLYDTGVSVSAAGGVDQCLAVGADAGAECGDLRPGRGVGRTGGAEGEPDHGDQSVERQFS